MKTLMYIHRDKCFSDEEWFSLIIKMKQKAKAKKLFGEVGVSINKTTISVDDISHRITNIVIKETGDAFGLVDSTNTSRGTFLNITLYKKINRYILTPIVNRVRDVDAINQLSLECVCLDVTPSLDNDINTYLDFNEKLEKLGL
jgi:hypothetical protein